MPTKSGHTSAILASKVVGTPVFDAMGGKIGHVQDVMLDKLSSRLAFAVLSSSGSSSLGHRYLPIPWAALDYDPGAQGYVVGLSEEQLKNAPIFGLDELTADDGVPAREALNRFYNAI
jgi:hypothetical protein